MDTLEPFMTKEEWGMLSQSVTNRSRVLEWGSGGSTIALAKMVHSVVSIEHTEHWAREVRKKGLKNVTVHHVTPNREPDGREDGTYEQFENYVRLPLRLGHKPGDFHVILIDGRARGACSETAAKLAIPETMVFMHDYKAVLPPDRASYANCLKWFTIENRVGSLVLLKRKM